MKEKDEVFELLTRMYADFSLQFKEVKAGIAGLDVRMSSLEGRMSSLEDRMSSLEDRMSSLEGRVSSLEDRMSSLEDRMSSLEGRVSSLEDRMTSLENRVSKIEIKLENNISRKLDILFEAQTETNRRLDRMERNIDNLAARIEKNELDIVALKAAK